MRYNGANIESGMLKAGIVYDFVYDGSYWNVVGELIDGILSASSYKDGVWETIATYPVGSKTMKIEHYSKALQITAVSGATYTVTSSTAPLLGRSVQLTVSYGSVGSFSTMYFPKSELENVFGTNFFGSYRFRKSVIMNSDGYNSDATYSINGNMDRLYSMDEAPNSMWQTLFCTSSTKASIDSSAVGKYLIFEFERIVVS